MNVGSSPCKGLNKEGGGGLTIRLHHAYLAPSPEEGLETYGREFPTDPVWGVGTRQKDWHPFRLGSLHGSRGKPTNRSHPINLFIPAILLY